MAPCRKLSTSAPSYQSHPQREALRVGTCASPTCSHRDGFPSPCEESGRLFHFMPIPLPETPAFPLMGAGGAAGPRIENEVEKAKGTRSFETPEFSNDPFLAKQLTSHGIPRRLVLAIEKADSTFPGGRVAGTINCGCILCLLQFIARNRSLIGTTCAFHRRRSFR